MKDSQSTPVHFRKWPKNLGGDVVAILPTHEGGSHLYTCGLYQHVGQHGDCDPQHVIYKTRPAKPEEYADLFREMEGLGYKLRVLKRIPRSLYHWNDKRKWWTTGSGRISLRIALEDAQACSHSGACDDDVAELRKDRKIKAQLKELDPETLRNELSEYGFDDDLKDHDANLSRILWLACGDIAEEAVLEGR